MVVLEMFNCHIIHTFNIYRIAGKFGGELNLAVEHMNQPTTKLKSANFFSAKLSSARMTIPYRTAKLKSANISET